LGVWVGPAVVALQQVPVELRGTGNKSCVSIYGGLLNFTLS